MSDAMFSSDYFFDGGLEVKQESPEAGVTASVPIPPRRGADLVDLRDFTVDLDLSQEAPPMYGAIQGFGKFGYDVDSLPKSECYKMDDDDIFQVDKADLIQGPTLAELNANPDTLLDDLNFDDLLLPEESSFCLHIGGAMVPSIGRGPAVRLQPSFTPQASPATPSHLHAVESAPSSPYDVYGRSQAAFSPSSQHSSASSSFIQPSNASNLQELMLKMESYGGEVQLGQSVPVSVVLPSAPPKMKQHSFSQQLSSSAPTHLTMDQIWQRREPRKHLLSTSSIAEAGSVSSLSGGLLSPEACELSQDEEEHDASDEDSDRYEDFSSDESDANESPETKQARANAKKERYFWQYNVQAKGPKGQRLVLKTKMEDPHVLNSVTDPVFSPDCSVRGIKHSGKARKGDGNDLTPNPRKLFLIGKELDNLGRIINDMIPVSELPFNVRPKTRKEKNKLASRACRLKKKAQHEANKLKLYGLEKEHKRLLHGIDKVKNIIANKVTNPQPETLDWNSHLHNIVSSATEVKIAGHTSDFVNQVLDNVKAGQHNGGLTDI